jgi:hypothetical protein
VRGGEEGIKGSSQSDRNYCTVRNVSHIYVLGAFHQQGHGGGHGVAPKSGSLDLVRRHRAFQALDKNDEQVLLALGPAARRHQIPLPHHTQWLVLSAKHESAVKRARGHGRLATLAHHRHTARLFRLEALGRQGVWRSHLRVRLNVRHCPNNDQLHWTLCE